MRRLGVRVRVRAFCCGMRNREVCSQLGPQKKSAGRLNTGNYLNPKTLFGVGQGLGAQVGSSFLFHGR